MRTIEDCELRIAELEAKLEAVAKLPEKWTAPADDESILSRHVRQLAAELSAILNPPANSSVCGHPECSGVACERRMEEPVPEVEKWATEKKAFLEGRKVEFRGGGAYSRDPWIEVKAHPDSWHTDPRVFYRVAPNPADPCADLLPTEDKEREEFERWWKDRCANTAAHKTDLKAAMLDAFATGRAGKEPS